MKTVSDLDPMTNHWAYIENCAATGIPIMAPGISNTCGVCGCKCLKPEDLLEDLTTDARAEITKFVRKEISSELCGGCGGKFID